MNIKDKTNNEMLKKILSAFGVCVAIPATSFKLFKRRKDMSGIKVDENNNYFYGTDKYRITVFRNYAGLMVCTIKTQPETIKECTSIALEMMSKRV